MGRFDTPGDEPGNLPIMSEMSHVLLTRILHHELPKSGAFKGRAQFLLGDAVRVRDEPVVRLRDELALIVLGLDVRDDERAAGLEEECERARDVFDGRKVVVGRAALWRRLP